MSTMPQPVPSDVPAPHGNKLDTTNANGSSNPAAADPAQGSAPPPEEGYPEQKHAGAVGYGPEYKKGADTGDKFQGLYEEAKGKVTKNPGLVQHGKELRAGELQRKEKEADDANDPFGSADGAGAGNPLPKTDSQQSTANPPSVGDTRAPTDQGAREQAATTAPEGTEEVNAQKEGVHRVKQIG